MAILTAQIGHYHDARYRALSALTDDFTVIATQNEADFAEFMASGVCGYRALRLFDCRAAYKKACTTGQVWSDVKRCLSTIDPSIVVVAGWATQESFAAIDWARRHRRHLVMLSDSQSSDAARSALRECVKARIVGLSDTALVGGPSHRDYITQLGIPSERVFMGYDVVDNSYFATGAKEAQEHDVEVRQSLGLPDRYLLASARFISKKNLPRLIQAYGDAMHGRLESPDLVILGDGPERGAVEEAISKAGLMRRVHLLGFRGYPDLPAIYGLSEGFVHVSTSEQWGLVINEAAASGVPVVASSACGATASLVEDNVTGFVVEAEHVESIRMGLSQLMDMDVAGRAVMGRAGQARMANWGAERFAFELLEAGRLAATLQPRGLGPVNSALLRVLSRRSIEAVQ